MASKEIHVIAIITPKPGKLDEVAKLMEDVAKKVQANEPGALTYYAVKSKDGKELIVVERYKNNNDLKVHGASPYFQEWSKAVGPLVASPPVLKFGSYAAGFDRGAKL